jgi:hypothetical protein
MELFSLDNIHHLSEMINIISKAGFVYIFT